MPSIAFLFALAFIHGAAPLPRHAAVTHHHPAPSSEFADCVDEHVGALDDDEAADICHAEVD